MKRLLPIALALTLLIQSVAFAAPQTIDLETMTLDELIKLRIAINRQIKALSNEDVGEPTPSPSPTPPKRVTISQGSYLVGKDIPVGKYSIRLTNNPSLELATVIIYNDSSKDPLGLISVYTIQPKRPIGSVELLDGYLVELNGDDVVFAPAKKPAF